MRKYYHDFEQKFDFYAKFNILYFFPEKVSFLRMKDGTAKFVQSLNFGTSLSIHLGKFMTIPFTGTVQQVLKFLASVLLGVWTSFPKLSQNIIINQVSHYFARFCTF